MAVLGTRHFGSFWVGHGGTGVSVLFGHESVSGFRIFGFDVL